MTLLAAANEFQVLSIDHGLTHKAYATANVFYAMALLEMDRDTGLVSPLGVAGSGAYFIGYCEKQKTTTSSTESEIAVNNRGDVAQSIAVTGVTADTDHGSIVYCTTDNISDDCTLTRAGADSLPIGRFQKHITSTTCDIKLFTQPESLRFSFSGGGRQTIFIGHYLMADITAADVATTVWTATGIGKIVGFYSITETVTGDATADVTLNLEINATNLSGGTIVLGDTGDATAMDVKGGRQDSSAITGNNTFGDGDTVSIEASSVTDYDDGGINIFMVVEYGT